MSCLDSVVHRLEEQRSAWDLEFQEMVTASLPGNLGYLYNRTTMASSDFATYALNQVYNNVETSVQNQVQGIANQLIDIFTYSDSIQIALFMRLSATLKMYVENRVSLTNSIATIANQMLAILNSIVPNDYDDIVDEVTAARNHLQRTVNYLKAVETGLLSLPPIGFYGYVDQADSSVQLAINVLNGDNSTSGLSLSEIPGALLDYIDDQQEQARISLMGLMDGLKTLATTVSVDIPDMYLVGSLAGLNLASLTSNNTLGGQNPKIKSTAQLMVAFPFHVATLNHVINASYQRVRSLRTLAEETKASMTSKLNSSSASRGDYTELYGYRVAWVGELNLISTMLGNSRNSIFGTLQTTTNDLITNVNNITSIIAYLGRPNYIRDINKQTEKMRAVTATMIPSILASVASPNSHARAKAYLFDLIVHCNIQRQQDAELLHLLQSSETHAIDNDLVAASMEQLASLEAEMGSTLADAWGVSTGTAVAQVASVLSPGIISNIAAPLFSAQDTALVNVLGDADLGYDDLVGGSLFGGIGQSITSLLACNDSFNTPTNYVELISGPDTLPKPESALIDRNQSVQNTELCMRTRANNNTIVSITIQDPSIDEVLLEDEFETGIAL
jgi:hypothetical protein